MTQYHHEEPLPDSRTLARLWGLFVALGTHWQNNEDPESMKSNFLVFITNRIRLDPSYADEYRNAAAVLDELITELGETRAYEKLMTDPAANISPPATRIAHARQRVSNEFIALQLALGGFKAFGATNYLGYISGPNIAGQPPYRIYRRRGS